MRGNSDGYSYSQTENRSQRGWLHALRLKGEEGTVKRAIMNGTIFEFGTMFVLRQLRFSQNFAFSQAMSKDGKPLAGAAKDSFMKKCENDA